jgi:uncharacterized protein HemX
MADPQTTFTLTEAMLALLAALGIGTGGVAGWKRWRNGHHTRRATYAEVEWFTEKLRDEIVTAEDRGHREIETAIREEGTKNRAATGRVVEAVQQMHIDLVKRTPPTTGGE